LNRELLPFSIWWRKRVKSQESKNGKVVPIAPERVRQLDLAEYGILEGDLLEAQARLDAKRREILAALLRGADVEDGPLRAFLDRDEKVGFGSSFVRARLIVR
jgi:hypothetical protein